MTDFLWIRYCLFRTCIKKNREKHTHTHTYIYIYMAVCVCVSCIQHDNNWYITKAHVHVVVIRAPIYISCVIIHSVHQIMLGQVMLG